MAAIVCPAEHELLPLVSGEAIATDLQHHLETCASCRERLRRLRAEVTNLRQAARDSVLFRARPAGGAGDTDEHPPPTVIVLAGGPGALPEARPTVIVPAGGGGAMPAPPAERPATIGKYVVVDELDGGGQAVVYRAVHPALGKELVVKLGRRPAAGDRAERDALVAEGKLLAELEHPHLARVYDLDFHHDRPFLVLEYVRGRNLQQALAADGRFAPRQAAALVAKLARALAVAHRRGIAHLDVKPSNVLLDEAGEPRLIDFGLARLRHGWTGDAAAPGDYGGTPAYVAPEQARGEADAVGPRSDLSALGGLLYALLTGKAPFEGGSAYESLAKARRCDFDRAALRTAGVPRRLEAVCLKAMAADPAERHATAEELAADLERFLRRHRVVAGVAAAAALLLVAAGLVWWTQQGRPRPAPERPPRVLVHRGDGVFDLDGALPLRTGDRLQVRCDLPRGLHATLLWVDGDGKLSELPAAAVSPGTPWDRLAYPASGVVPLEDPPGTEFLLVCARRSGPVGRGEVAALWGQGGPWPALPARVRVELSRDRVEAVGPRGAGAAEENPTSTVADRLDRLREALRDRCDYVTGVAFAHQ
jgi:tRNA A-37 threonylcarbamoyl transferase component Bud32